MDFFTVLIYGGKCEALRDAQYLQFVCMLSYIGNCLSSRCCFEDPLGSTGLGWWQPGLELVPSSKKASTGSQELGLIFTSCFVDFTSLQVYTVFGM